jgi:hypothetical protein
MADYFYGVLDTVIIQKVGKFIDTVRDGCD